MLTKMGGHHSSFSAPFTFHCKSGEVFVKHLVNLCLLPCQVRCAVLPARDDARLRLNEPWSHQMSYIQNLVRQGFIVGTRADADTVDARTGLQSV